MIDIVRTIDRLPRPRRLLRRRSSFAAVLVGLAGRRGTRAGRRIQRSSSLVLVLRHCPGIKRYLPIEVLHLVVIPMASSVKHGDEQPEQVKLRQRVVKADIQVEAT